MIVQCATFYKNLNPRNIAKSVSDIRIRIRFPFKSSFWITGIQPENRIVIISGRRVYTALGALVKTAQ